MEHYQKTVDLTRVITDNAELNIVWRYMRERGVETLNTIVDSGIVYREVMDERQILEKLGVNVHRTQFSGEALNDESTYCHFLSYHDLDKNLTAAFEYRNGPYDSAKASKAVLRVTAPEESAVVNYLSGLYKLLKKSKKLKKSLLAKREAVETV